MLFNRLLIVFQVVSILISADYTILDAKVARNMKQLIKVSSREWVSKKKSVKRKWPPGFRAAIKFSNHMLPPFHNVTFFSMTMEAEKRDLGTRLTFSL